jgi:hypothetical protein
VAKEESVRKQRRHRSRIEADHLAAEYESSTLSREAFSNERGISVNTLARYVARYRKQTVGSNPQRLVAVELAGHNIKGSELAVLLPGGHRIEVQPGFDTATLRQLVAALEQV